MYIVMEFVPFVKCNDPVKVYDRMGVPSFVPCGKCQICEVQKHTHLSQLLQVEEQHSKHCAFITLTYDEEFLPIANFGSLMFSDFGVGTTYQPYYENQRIQEDIAKGLFTPRCLVNTPNTYYYELEKYNLRRDLYKSRYSNCVNITYEHDKVAFLYPRDLQLFIKRLRKYISDNYNEKVRFYAIGEYGTQSLRPHWHLLLFYSSDELFRDFEDVVDLGTSRKPCETALFLCDLWEYGITSSCNTDGKAFYYVSSYVNKPAEFPNFLHEFAPQKCYHSLFLGQICKEEDTTKCLRDRRFEDVGKTSVVSSDGSVHDVSVRRSLLSRLLPKFSGVGFEDVALLHEQLFAYLKARHLADSVIEQSYIIYESFLNSDAPSPTVKRLVEIFSYQCSLCLYNENEANLSSLTSALYASRRFLHAADELGIDYDEYFNIYVDYYKWLGLKTLGDFYDGLQNDSQSADIYYSDFRSNGDCINNCRTSGMFLRFRAKMFERHGNSIKHRTISDRYKFLQQ